ncbi:MAG TPA: 1,4-alpha-glucan branching protein domain-containing protein [Gemmatimonadaceae bacterium]
MSQMDVVVMLHSHLPYVLNHGRWPHGSDWICEAAIDTYLPLVEKFRTLDAMNIAAPVTIGFTPILANQLEHPAFVQELEAYFDQRLGFCDEAPASLESTGDSHLLPLVEYWRSRLVRLRLLFHEIGRDIPREFRRLQDAGRLEVTSSAATHGFLPLLKRDESIRLQLALGAAEHRRIFGRPAEGCWLPECAYRPGGAWTPFGQVAGDREGIETHVARSGFRYFFVDSHMARAGSPLGVYGELFAGETVRLAREKKGKEVAAVHTPYEAYRVTDATAARPVAALVRDPRSSMQVWSRHGGYPGAAPYLEFHKIRWPGGLKLWRVSEPGTDLGNKTPYEPDSARRQATDHATHFAHLLDQVAKGQGAKGGNVIVAPFDTELFGHWWFEGPDFLGDLYAQLPQFASLRATTAGGHFDAHAPRSGLRLATGSWGANGDFSMWNGPLVEWTWPVVWEVEDRFWSLAPRALADGRTHEILAQAARSMLLLQSSDWQFIISTGEVEDYAIRRFNGHAGDCAQLLAALEEALSGKDVDGGVRLAHELRRRDDVFRNIVPSIQAAISDRRSTTRVDVRSPAADR